jgi:hypothetical protein
VRWRSCCDAACASATSASARYANRLGPESAGAALVTGSGRVLLDPKQHWSLVQQASIPAGGGTLLLPSGVQAVAEPIEDADLYVVRPRRTRSRVAAPMLELRLLGAEPPVVQLDRRDVRLRRRHVELLTLLMLHRGRASADVLADELYGEAGHPASIRVEMSRLRKLLPGTIEPEGYGLTCEVDSDVKHVRAMLAGNAVADAAAAYPGPLLPDSEAPGIRRETAGSDTRSSPPMMRTRCGRGCARRRGSSTCRPGAGCSRRSSTATPGAVWPWPAPRRYAVRSLM